MCVRSQFSALILAAGTLSIYCRCCVSSTGSTVLNRLLKTVYVPRYKHFNTLRTGAFKLFKCTFPGSKQFKSTFILCFFKYL